MSDSHFQCFASKGEASVDELHPNSIQDIGGPGETEAISNVKKVKMMMWMREYKSVLSELSYFLDGLSELSLIHKSVLSELSLVQKSVLSELSSLQGAHSELSHLQEVLSQLNLIHESVQSVLHLAVMRKSESVLSELSPLRGAAALGNLHLAVSTICMLKVRTGSLCANEQTVTSNNHDVLIGGSGKFLVILDDLAWSRHQALEGLGTSLQAPTATDRQGNCNNRDTSLQAPTSTASTKSNCRKGNCNNLVLLIAAILVSLTFHAGLRPPLPVELNHRNHAVFLWFNSAVFVASEAMIASLAQELPLKLWLLVPVFSLFGTYICSIMTIFPRTALAVLCAGSPLLVFVAASGRTIGFQCFSNALSP